jgi:hypothetical protein
VAISADRTLLATASDDKTVRLWRLDTMSLQHPLRPPIGDGADGRLYGVAFHPQLPLIAGAGTPIKAADITAQILANCFDLDEVIVADSSKDSANEGQAVDIDQIWSDEYAVLLRVPKTNRIEEPCLARTIHWGADGSVIGGQIETYYEEQNRGDIVRVRHETQERIMYTALGYLLSNIIDPAILV